MEDPNLIYSSISKRIAKHNFQVKALIQDILACRKSMDLLNELNEMGRSKIAELREEIENLEIYGREMNDEIILTSVDAHRQQLSGTLKAFKEANIASMFAIEKAHRDELMKPPQDSESTVRQRGKMDKSGLIKLSSGVTEQLLSISRQLANTTQRSQDTLDNLMISSSTVQGTREELENTAGSISQSSKLLKKYGRREFTDKILMFFAFLFFLACAIYVLQKRLL